MSNEGTVSHTSKYGFQLDATAQKWYNWANEYENHPDLKKGDAIVFDTNEKGYVTAVERQVTSEPSPDDGRDRLITRRVQALQAAISFLQTPVDTATVLDIAESFEVWLFRA